MTTLLLTNARLAGASGPAVGAAAGLVDVLLDGGRIAAVTPTGAAGAGHAVVTGDVVDLDGRTVVPGLWDAHTHLTQWALVRHRLDVSWATSAAHAADLVRDRLRYAAAPAGGQPLVGYGFRWATWPDQPTAELLDAVAGEVPVVLLSGDLHSAWASTAGLRFLGIAHHPSGLLREEEWMPASPRIVTVEDDVADALVADAARAAAARGVVGVVDLEVDDNLTTWRRRVARGWDGLRVRAGVWEQHLDAVLDAGLRDGDPLLDPAAGPAATSDLVRQGPLKVISDGSLNTLTAYCFDPYGGAGHDGHDGHHGQVGHAAHGVLNVETDHLVPLMARAHAAGLRCAIHAIGDRANALALDAFAASGARGSVEHAQLLRREDVARFADLGVTASVQPEHAMDDRDVAEELWPGRTARAFPLAELRAAGVRLSLGSDAPVAPLDPWVAVAAAVTRSRDGREPWHPEQRIDVAAALAASTGGRPLHLAVGGPADLAVLDVDPLAPDADLRTMPVSGTLVAGRWTHRAL
ncbi:amidohydrolase [Isoptericola cucumis]|uniref:amidohydrolase n=1 Tax=Isoptericola cucumis TaxID=1776856 RepID=UPI0035309CCC